MAEADSRSTTIAEIRTTFASREAAEECARRLVAVRVAACVQIDGPVRSIFRWQGLPETADEWRCTCKTTVERETDCLREITAGHDYETPELIVVRATASAAYASWVRQCVDGG